MNSTAASAYPHLPQVSAALRLHIVSSGILSCFCVPAIIICKIRDHRYLRIVQVSAIIIIFLAGISSFFASDGFSFTAHRILGISIFLAFGTFMILDFSSYKNEGKRLSSLISYLPRWKFMTILGSFVLVASLAAEFVLGLASLFNFCAYPYTQQCFGHFGIGGWYMIYFSFCAALSVADVTWLKSRSNTRNWTPEMADAVFIMPCGFGLAFFGHAWSEPWDTEDLQHVFLGALAIIGSTLGLILPHRNIFPGLVSSVAGYTFLTHSQDPRYPLLGNLHQGVGWLLYGVGVSSIIDVGLTFYQPHADGRNLFASPWRYMASFSGISAGLVIMSANAEEAALLDKMGAKSVVMFLGLLGVTMGVYAYLYILVSALMSHEKSGYEAVEMEDV